MNRDNKGDTGNDADTGKPASSGEKRPRHTDQQSGMGSSARQPRNVTASVAARLLKVAHERDEEYQLALMRYGLERFLYRLGRSPYAGQFVVKGAVLFTLWAAQLEQAEHTEARLANDEVRSRPTAASAYIARCPHRATHDLDLLGFGPFDLGQLEQVFRDLCQLQLSADEDDGLTFQPETARAVPICENQEYGGIRAHLLAMLGKARIPLQVDVGFGDVVTPAPQAVAFPTLLPDLPAPDVRVYPRETVVAEKFEAIVRLGLSNTRMKDFYDLWMLANHFAFEGDRLCAALRATFARRRIAARERGTDRAHRALRRRQHEARTKWPAFLRKGRLTANSTPDLSDVLAAIRAFLLPPCAALESGDHLRAHWPPGGRWALERR